MPNYQHQAKMAALKLKEFNWGDENNIRKKDVDIFKTAAYVFNHVIILRATNPRSIEYIGQKNFTAKPIDCKPKTADLNGLIAGKIVKSAGLVVDPTLLPNAFNSTDKQNEALLCWKNFMGITPSTKAIRRFRSCGFYIVDTYKDSPNYGCLMVSNHNLPFEDFTLETKEYWQIKESLHLKYIHGDYDLYGLIDVSNVKSGYNNLPQKERYQNEIAGVGNYFRPHY